MAAPPLPRPSVLQHKTSGGMPPTTWDGLYEAASEVKKVKLSVAALTPAGFVAAHMRPSIAALEAQLENEALKHFGLLGRLALDYKSLKDACAKFDSPVKVLAYGVHSAVLSLGFVCTGSQVTEFSQIEEWPNFVPPGFLNDSGTTFSARYRPKSMAADKLVVKGVLSGENYVVTASDPYSSGASALTVHLRLKDFVKPKALGESPTLVESKERELLSVIEERVIPAANISKTAPSPRLSNMAPSSLSPQNAPLQLPVAYPVVEGRGRESNLRAERDYGRGDLGGFPGDLMPGVGGSMLFGPGNPQFDRMQRPSNLDPRDPRSGLPRGVPPGARYDPIGPFVTGGGDPDPDNEPMPGGNRYI